MTEQQKRHEPPKTLSSPEDIFNYFEFLADKNDHPIIFINFAYGWFSFDKFEWIQRERERGYSVTEGDLRKWIEQKPLAWYERLYNDAFEVFYNTAQEISKETIENKIKEAIKASILSEIKLSNQNAINIIDKRTSGWRSFVSNVGAGIVSSFIVAAIALFLYYTTRDDPSLTGIGRRAIEAPIAPPSSR